MKNLTLFALILCCTSLGYTKEQIFDFSSDPLLQTVQPAINYGNGFLFIPKFRVNQKNAVDLLNTAQKELEQFAIVVKKSTSTPAGLDLEVLDNTPLIYTIEELVDENNKPISILKASLSINNFVDLVKTGQNISLNTNAWHVYMEITNDVKKAIKKSLPILLKAFVADFQKANPNMKKPTLYISYDESYYTLSEKKH